jgi:hypothetical protein
VDPVSTIAVVVIALLFLAPPIYVAFRILSRLTGHSKDELPPGPDGL